MWLLREARVVSPEDGLSEVLDLRVVDGRVAELGRGLAAGDAPEVDGRGRAVLPAFTDLVAEIPDPGQEWREDVSSGSLAAAAGGFATVLVSPVADPVLDQGGLAAAAVARGQAAPGARLLRAGALTMGLQGQQLGELGSLIAEGCVALSDGGRPVEDLAILRNALEYARPFGAPVLLRPGVPSLEARGCMHEGATSLQIGLRGIPAASEEIGVAAIVSLVRLTGARVHLSHLGTARGLELLLQAQAEGLPLSASVPARNLVLTDEAVGRSGYDPRFRLLPPLRTEDDRQALVQAVREGRIAVCSDHQPWTRVEKEHEFERAEPGSVGLETAFSATLTALGGDLVAAARALASLPARVLGRSARIAVGEPADLVLVDPHVQVPVGPPRRSKGSNEALQGLALRGRVEATWRQGERCPALSERGPIR